MSPQVGDKVRLVATHGVASPTMRAQVGKTGTVIGARRSSGHLEVHASFPTIDGAGDRFWLTPDEYELVPVPPPPAPTERPVDFAATVQQQIDRLAEEDARVAAQMAELATRRGALVRERRALDAARAAYLRVQQGGTESRAPRESPAVPYARRWAREHGGQVVLAEAIPAAVRDGVCPTPEQVRDRLTWAVRRLGSRVSKGVYRLEVSA